MVTSHRALVFTAVAVFLSTGAVARVPQTHAEPELRLTAWGEPDLRGAYLVNVLGARARCGSREATSVLLLMAPFTRIRQYPGIVHIDAVGSPRRRAISIVPMGGEPVTEAYAYPFRSSGYWDRDGALVIVSDRVKRPVVEALTGCTTHSDAVRVVERLVAAGPHALSYEFATEESPAMPAWTVMLHLTRHGW